MFIGFTGTPLLKADAKTGLEVFGGYIHTYKFSEGVEDGVVPDLVYEARDIDQRLGSEDKIDAWFEAKTRGLNDWQKDELKKHWGTMPHIEADRPIVRLKHPQLQARPANRLCRLQQMAADAAILRVRPHIEIVRATRP